MNEFIDGVEYDDGGMPVHIWMSVNKNGDGPLNDDDPEVDRIVCWCGDDTCTKYMREDKHDAPK